MKHVIFPLLFLLPISVYADDCFNQYSKDQRQCQSTYSSDDKISCLEQAQERSATCYRQKKERELHYKCSKPDNKYATDCDGE